MEIGQNENCCIVKSGNLLNNNNSNPPVIGVSLDVNPAALPATITIKVGGIMTVKLRLLDPVREKIRLKHYNIRTEHAYVGWSKRDILFHGKVETLPCPTLS
jgi:hypothetical protein